jgi:hypothetical protein
MTRNRRGDIQNRPSLLGEPAQNDETRRAAAFTRQRPADVFPLLDREYRVATAANVNAGESLASLRAAVPTNGDIVLEAKFPEGLGKLMDGVVQCLNAFAWAQKESAAAGK